MDRRIIAAAWGIVLPGLAGVALAAPYASGVSESGGNVTFTLSEAADEVIVLRDGVPTSLGALGAGSHMFARSGAVNYSIVARKTSGSGYLDVVAGAGFPLQLSSDLNPLMSFLAPRGVAVNTNPANGALFGRIYVSNATAGTTIGNPTPIRDVGDGMYLLNADHSDALGQGTNALTGGITFGAAVSPWRVALDDAGFVYMADWEDDTGTIYRADPNMSAGANMLAGQGSSVPIAPTTALNHGSVGGLAVGGSLAAGNLTVWNLDEDLSPDGTANDLNSVWRYNVNAGPLPHDAVPTLVAKDILIDNFGPGGIIVDLARDPSSSKFYLMQSRSDGNEPGVGVVAADGTKLSDSLQESRDHGIDGNPGVEGMQDVLRLCRGIEISPDGRFMGISLSGSDVRMVPLLAGLPDIVNTYTVDTFDDIAAGRDIAFDAAGNLYVISSGNQAMRVFSPGGRSVTSFNSNGSFHMDPTYNAGTGNYSTSASWLAGIVPNADDEVANFSEAGDIVNVNMDIPVTLGAIKITSASPYVLSGSSTITLQGQSPNVITQQGNHMISAPLLLTQSSGLVANGGILRISDLNVTPTPVNPVEIFTGGNGWVEVNKVVAQRLYVTQGRTRILPNGTVASTSNVKRLDIAGGISPIAQLDIFDNAFVVDYTPPPAGPDVEPFDTIKAQIISGYANGTWTGDGIMSFFAAANSTHAVGYAEASALTSVPAIFGAVDSTAVLLRYTRYGDANLDGLVNLADFNRLAGNFGSTGVDWSGGDFNYDSLVNLQDFNRLAGNFGLTASPSGPTPEDWAALAAAVPEPSSMLLLGAGAMSLLRRRRLG